MKTLKFEDFKVKAEKNVITSTEKIVGGEKEYYSNYDSRFDVLVE